MGKREIIIKKLSEFKKEASKKIPIAKLIFFGSRALGKAREESDIDLIVVSEYFKNIDCARGKYLYDFWDLNYAVDFLCYTPKEFEKLSKKVSIVSMAIKEGIQIN